MTFEKMAGLFVLVVLLFAVSRIERQARQDIQPTEAARFTITLPGSSRPTKFSVLEYKTSWYQVTAEMNTEFAHLVSKRELTPEVIAAYQKLLVERDDPKLCTDGQRVEDDQCLKCEGYVVTIVPCKSDPLRMTPQRFTYLGVLHE